MLNGHTYSYMNMEARAGQEEPCCRPTRQSCRRINKWKSVCKMKSWKTRCGRRCTRFIKHLERLQRKEEKKGKAGQKLSQHQLNMLESAAKLRETSTNPLCDAGEKPNSRPLVLFTCGRGICKSKQPTPRKRVSRLYIRIHFFIW